MGLKKEQKKEAEKMEENREKNNKKIEDEKRLEQDLRQMADDVILPDSLEPEAIQKMLQARQEEKQQGSKTKKNKKNWKRIVPIWEEIQTEFPCLYFIRTLSTTFPS